MKTSAIGRKAICIEEGYREFAYPDPVSKLAKATPRVKWGFSPASEIIASLPDNLKTLDPKPWTCGYGQTGGVTMDTRMSKTDAENDLLRSLPKYELLVNSACPMTTQSQFDALVCLAWNCPSALSAKSSIVKAHNRGDFASAAAAFLLYNKSGGVVNSSLTERRKRESSMYVKDVLDVSSSPQTVDTPSSLSASKINMAQAATGATAGITAINEALNAVQSFKDGIAGLGTWLLPIAMLVIVGLCGYTIWKRYDLRRRGML